MASPATPFEHVVQVYRDHAELAEAVATFIGAGLEAGDPAVLIVTAAHRPSICDRLERRGLQIDELEAQGLLTIRDAEATLAALYDGSELSARRFDEVVGSVFDTAEAAVPGRRVHAFGEMVDVLVRRDEPDAADELEGLWNDLGARRNFALLCGYRVDLLDVEAHVALLPRVYRSHSHVLPPPDADRFDDAVRRALVDVLGDDAQKVYENVARHEHAKTAPEGQLALVWVSAHMPRTAQQVVAAARSYYAAA
jgi:hypothetical protein